MKTLEKIGVISLAKMQGLIGLIFGLLYGIFFYIAYLISPQEVLKELEMTGQNLPLGPMALVIGPVVGLVYGFIAGLLIAFLYNVLAKLVGGVNLELKEK